MRWRGANDQTRAKPAQSTAARVIRSGKARTLPGESDPPPTLVEVPSESDELLRVRAEIDALDERVVALLADRQRLVRQAGMLKRDRDEVRAPARRAAMMAKREAWAREAGVEPAVVAATFTAMVDAFVALELREHAERSP